MMNYSLYLANEQATMDFAANVATVLHAPCLFNLQGDLGAGKTCFVRGVLHALGYQGKVKSPTYTLMEPYEIAGQHYYHFDLYRLADAEELELLGARDVLTDGVCFFEWPDKGVGWLPAADVELTLLQHETGRQANLLALSRTGEQIIAKLKA